MFRNHLLLIAIVTIAFLTVSISQVANGQEFVTDGLVLYYSFDKDTVTKNKVTDLSGEGNDGKIEGKLKSIDGPPKGILVKPLNMWVMPIATLKFQHLEIGNRFLSNVGRWKTRLAAFKELSPLGCGSRVKSTSNLKVTRYRFIKMTALRST